MKNKIGLENEFKLQYKFAVIVRNEHFIDYFINKTFFSRFVLKWLSLQWQWLGHWKLQRLAVLQWVCMLKTN